MSNIFQLAKEFKSALEKIDPEYDFASNKTSNLDPTDSPKFFVDFALMPDVDLTLDESIATGTDKDNYSKNVLQALWNIAEIISHGKMHAIGNRALIEKSLAYLDKSNVPKIVDKRTADAGRALEDFLTKAMSEECINSLPRIPFLDIKKIFVENLSPMKDLLQNRLTVYAGATPEVKKLLQTFQEREQLWKSEASNALTISSEVKNFLNHSEEVFESDLSPNTLESEILTRKDLLAQIRQTREAFRSVNEQNNTLGLPQEHIIPDYMNNLIWASKPPTAEQWKELYNTSKTKFVNKQLQASLDEKYKSGNNIIEDFDKLEKFFLAQIERLEVFQKLEPQKQKLESQLVINMDDFGFLALSGEQLSFNLPQNIDDTLDIHYYEAKIAELEDFQKKLAAQQKILELEEKNLIHDGEKFLNKGADQALVKQIQTWLKPLSNRNHELVTQAQELLSQTQEKLQDLKTQLSKQSAEGRDKLLDEAAASRLGAYKAQNNAQENFNLKSHQLTQYLASYGQNVKHIEEKYKTSLSTLDDLLSAQAEKRRNFLTEAEEKLIGFKPILKNPDLSIAQIPRAVLEAMLESKSDSHLNALIQRLYEEKSQSSWWQQTVNIFSTPTESDSDTYELLAAIDKKLAQITDEKGVDIHEQTPPSSESNTEGLASNNLYRISAIYQQKSRDFEKNKTEELASLDRGKTYLEHAKSQAETRLRLNTIASYREQIKELNLRIESKLYEVPERPYRQMNLDQALQAYKQNSSAFNLLEEFLDGKKSRKENSLKDLINKRNDLLSAYEKQSQSVLNDADNYEHLQETSKSLEEQIIPLKQEQELLRLLQYSLRLLVEAKNISDGQGADLLDEIRKLNDQLNILDSRAESQPANLELIAVIRNAQVQLQEIAKNLETSQKTPLAAKVEVESEVIIPTHKEILPKLEHTECSPNFTTIKTLFFDDNGSKGLFNIYLEKRAEHFWFKDFCSTIASAVLGCAGYKSEMQLRKDYLNILEDIVTDYATSPSTFTAHQLESKLQEGLKQFSPRDKEGTKGYQQSLHFQLSALKTAFEKQEASYSAQESDAPKRVYS